MVTIFHIGKFVWKFI
jgi:hypothetical protein